MPVGFIFLVIYPYLSLFILQTFLGQKYGYRPFPSKILEKEFEVLRDAIVAEGKSTELLDQWFKKDENAVPGVYTLQRVSSILTHFNDNENSDAMREDKNKWWEIFEELQALLKDAAVVCKNGGKLSEKAASKFIISGMVSCL